MSGAAPDDRDPQHLDATIERLVHERGWVTEVAVAGAIARWDTIVGPEVAAHCRAVRFADGELTVQADSTAWATQVRLLAPSLVRRLNEELGDGTVRRVTVLGPAAPRWRGRARRTRDSRGPRDTYG
jgi:predicted nucleic acid-binding Zn ribbon protein